MPFNFTDVRCPHCDRLQFRAALPVVMIEGKCRWKTLYVVCGMDVMLSGASATVCSTFEGMHYGRYSVTR